MIPVEQTILGGSKGNCLEACVASVLEVGINDIPSFAPENPSDWFENLQRFVGTLGIFAAHIPNDPKVNPIGFHIGVLDYLEWHNSEATSHAVVCRDGAIVHCPHPSKKGFDYQVRYWIVLVQLGNPLMVYAR